MNGRSTESCVNVKTSQASKWFRDGTTTKLFSGVVSVDYGDMNLFYVEEEQKESGKIIKSSLINPGLSFLPRTSSALKISQFSSTGKSFLHIKWFFFLRKHLRDSYRNDKIYVLLVIMVHFFFFLSCLHFFILWQKNSFTQNAIHTL